MPKEGDNLSLPFATPSYAATFPANRAALMKAACARTLYLLVESAISTNLHIPNQLRRIAPIPIRSALVLQLPL